MMPGLALKSVPLFIVCMGVAYFYAAKIKPSKSRGWLTGWIAFTLKPKVYFARLEKR